MNRYQKQMDELRYTEQGKRQLAQALLQARQPQRIWRRGRTLAVGAAAALVLGTAALAASTGLRELLSQQLGGFEPLALVADGQTVTDQGIEMRVVSAITDGMATEIYVEARDLQGDRLVDDAIDVSGLIRQPQAEADAKERAEKGKVSSWVTRQECVGYDPETKTALLRFGRYNHEQTESPDGQEELNLQIFSLLPRNYQAQADLPQGLLTEQTRKSRKLETGETVLEPNQTPAELENPWISLSSLGFDEQGKLHLQLELPAQANQTNTAILATVYSKKAEALDMNKDEDIEEANRLFRAYNGDSMEKVLFTQDGKLYQDICFSATVEDLDDLILDAVYGTVTMAEPIEGVWELPATIQRQQKTAIQVDQKVDGALVQDLILSPLSLYITGNGHTYSRNPAVVTLKDGSQIKGEGRGAFVSPELSTCRWQFEQPVDWEQVAAVEINGWKIPIENGQAGPVEKPAE